jgi:hypothetical protein
VRGAWRRSRSGGAAGYLEVGDDPVWLDGPDWTSGPKWLGMLGWKKMIKEKK